MKKWWSVLALLIGMGVLFGTEADPDIFDFDASKEHVLDKRQNYFLTSTDYQIAPKVNPITGEYCEEELDLVVAGAQPLSVRRFYNSNSPYDPRYATWRYNPESFFVANMEWGGQEIFAAIGDVDGSVCSLKRSATIPYTFDFELPKSFATSGVSGQSHPLNTKINYYRFGDPKDKKRFQYMGTISDGSGRERSFASKMHRWTGTVHWTEKKRGFGWGSDRGWIIHPNTWTPYHIPIVEERLPNGNILCYTYTQWKEEKRNFPLPQLLASITAYNADKSKVLGHIYFHYPRTKHDEVKGVQVTGSDGRSAFMQHAGKSPIKLASAQRPGQPPISYGSHNTTLNTLLKPDGRVLTTEYNPEGKVSAQYAPVGPNGEMCPICRCEYQDQLTVFYDSENNKTHYRYDSNKKITSIETYQDNALYRIDRFMWDAATGNLIRKTIENSSGIPLQITEYQYDKNQNPIMEKVEDGKECYRINRTFSDDGFNLKLSESDRDDKRTCYSYLPGTNLLTSTLIYEGPTICQRTFHTYDDCAICIKTIVDDGSSLDPDDLQNVTYRKITQITPKQTLPCFGLPEIVQEKTIDASGQEILLRKTIYAYTPFGKISREEHYDCNNLYRYCILNDYDSKERLIATTDPLGNHTTFAYDDNHNLTSIAGPRCDQYKEITYDKANRPTRIADWQTDGSLLITEKQYDKLGQITAEIDACSNITRFEHDALGRIIAVIHPDGGVEKREYNVLGHVTKEINPLGHETYKTYNFKGQPLSIHYPNGSEDHFTYFAHGPISSHIDQNGAQKIYTLDIFDHPIKTSTYSSGKLLKTTMARHSPFYKLSETDGKGVTTFYSYDFAGRKIAEQKDYKKRFFAYDSLGALEHTQEGEITWIEKHDFLGQIIEKRTEKNGALQFQENYVYDHAGNRIQTINSQGINEIAYNTYGKPLISKDPLGHIIHFNYSYQTTLTETTTNPHHIQTIQIYDSKGRNAGLLKKNIRAELIQQTQNTFDLNNQRTELTHTVFKGTIPTQTIIHHWDYGPMGRVERLIEAGIKQTQYLYDSKGRLQTIIKPNGDHLNHEYDDWGRLARYFSRDYDYHYTYDLNDCVLSIYDTTTQKKTTRTYDSLNNILQEDLANDLSLFNSYDNQSRRILLTLPDSTSIAYSYDGVFLHQVLRKGIGYTYAERNLEGLLLKAILPQDLGEITIQRDPLGRLKQCTSSFYTSQLSYDAVGNLTQNKFQDSLGKQKCTYQFDDLDQLISEEEHTYHFDSLYNRLKKDTLDHEVNTLCQITHDGHTPHLFDANGNLLSNGIRKFTYDSQDRLIAIDEKNTRIEYEYDPLHRRLSKKVFIQGKQTKYDRYLWDGDNEIGVIDQNGIIQELRILGEGMGAEIGAAVLYELKGKTYIPLHDHQGSVTTLVDLNTKNPIECYRYTAYGEELTDHNLSPWRFSSKRVEDTGLIFFGRRYYNPELGRWITQDPEGFENGPNLYAYVNNCPLTHFDLYGLKMFDMFRPDFQGNFEKPYWNKSCAYDLSILKRPELPNNGHIFFANGMFNTLGEASRSALYISDLSGGYNIKGLYNPTHGPLVDPAEAYWGLRGVRTNPVEMIKNEWKEKLEALSPNQFALHLCHSQGTILTNLALQDSPDEIRKRIRVVAFAPADYISRDICHSVQRYEASFSRDPIPWINWRGRQQNRDTIKVLPSHPNAPWHDHSILSPTFEKALKYEIERYRETIGKS